MSVEDGINRRQFLALTSSTAIAAAVPRPNLKFSSLWPPMKQAGPTLHIIPESKNFSPEWLESLTNDSHPHVFQGDELKFIGMPIGGICCGQVNLGGDGRLWLWSIFNQITFGVANKTVAYNGQNLGPSGGANYVDPPTQIHPFQQGFWVRYSHNQKTETRSLDEDGWSSIRFTGEYPIGFVDYQDQDCPLKVHLEAYSPFVPLHTDQSSLPCVVMKYTVDNLSSDPIQVELGGWLQNFIGGTDAHAENNVQRVLEWRQENEFAIAICKLQPIPAPDAKPEIIFETFNNSSYRNWKVEGEAFGPGPIEVAKMPRYQGDVGAVGNRIACSHNARDGRNVEQADALTGKLTSRPFTINRKYIAFLIAGGNHPHQTCINLVINGQIARTQTGQNSNVLTDAAFDVTEYYGQTAHLEIVDSATGAWGNISIDHIVFTDIWPSQAVLDRRTNGGTMALSCLEGGKSIQFAVGESLDQFTKIGSERLSQSTTNKPFLAYIGNTKSIPAHGSATLTFALSWSFPNLTLPLLGKVGHLPSTRFQDLVKLTRHLASNKAEYDLTKKWHDTWYDSTLPRWFLDRVMGNTATLSTMTSTQFRNGRFYGWEGIGCCDGTCGHVYQYAHAMARLFPDLERSVRKMVDFGIAFHPDSGIIDFRGEYGEGYAVDSQSGYVLRAYREHQMSADSRFLTQLWPRIKKALGYMIQQDGKQSGLLTNRQHNTLDVDLYGPSSWLSSLYLAALQAGELMAKEMEDLDFAKQCQEILSNGYKNFSKTLWNGSYFVSKPSPNHPNSLQYGDGCEVDQVMGQAWLYQIGCKNRLFDNNQTLSALKSIYKNNFLPDVGPFRKKYEAGRWFALPGEGGLVICTFPKHDREAILGPNPTWASMYFNECMTGFEYEAASHMIAEGLVQEGLAVIRTVHDRYSPQKRNPWNEVECSDHYARCMAVYGAFITLTGFEHHGPQQHLGFDPKLSPEKFRCAFTACNGWGTYHQEKLGNGMHYRLQLVHGELLLKTLTLRLPPDSQFSHFQVILGGNPVGKVQVEEVENESTPALTNGNSHQLPAQPAGALVKLTLPSSVLLSEKNLLQVLLS